MKKHGLLTAIIIAMVFGGCSHKNDSINQQQLADMINKGAVDYVLDTREKAEFDVSHIEGARHVGYKDFNEESINNIDPQKTIVVYCSLGVRSGRVQKQMQELGYTNVLNLEGGIFQWVNQDYVVVDTNGQPTKKVHAYSRFWGLKLKKGEKVYG